MKRTLRDYFSQDICIPDRKLTLNKKFPNQAKTKCSEFGRNILIPSAAGNAAKKTRLISDISIEKKYDKIKQTQMYLDFGQSSFGKRKKCEICGMVYVVGQKDDESSHDQFCKEYTQGVSFPKWKRERVVSSCSNERIVEIRPTDPSCFRLKEQEVKTIIDAEMGFVDTSKNDDNHTIFLFISCKKIIGYCSVEVISSAYELRNFSERDKIPIKRKSVMLGIRQIWCHRNHRKEKIASKLVTIAREKMVYGCFIPIENIAFSSPTSDGYMFAKRYTKTDKILMYDLSAIIK